MLRTKSHLRKICFIGFCWRIHIVVCALLLSWCTFDLFALGVFDHISISPVLLSLSLEAFSGIVVFLLEAKCSSIINTKKFYINVSIDCQNNGRVKGRLKLFINKLAKLRRCVNRNNRRNRCNRSMFNLSPKWSLTWCWAAQLWVVLHQAEQCGLSTELKAKTCLAFPVYICHSISPFRLPFYCCFSHFAPSVYHVLQYYYWSVLRVETQVCVFPFSSFSLS